jgi:hypothetical protein
MPLPDQPPPIGLTDPTALPGADPSVEEVRRAAAENAPNLDGLVEVVGGVAEAAASVVDVGDVVVSAAEVGGEVVGGALEAVGSGLELAGGCAEGCSIMIAVVVLLATAGTALALGWY